MNKNRIITIILLAILFPLGMFAGYQVGHQDTVARQKKADMEALHAPYPELHNNVIAEKINDERMKLGVAALSYNQQLEASACAKADDMIAENYWAHTAPDGTHWSKLIPAAGYVYYRAGENLAYGQRTDQEVVTDWMNSATHKANIVDPSFSEFGVCVRYGNFQGGQFAVIVNHFGSRQ